tara:strand:+ start:7441 stop:7701 length:261 start_codon:yes stop_codon:yes gene_type:complete
VPDLSQELEELHASVVRAVRDRIDSGEQSNDDLRTAMQLLKQNAITAQIDKDTAAELKSQMARKLDFSALNNKVVPIKPADQKKHG